MHLNFEKSKTLDFFKLLPADWQESIVSYWKSYSKNAVIYTFNLDGKIIAGGIVFSTCSPDMMYNPEEAKKWFDAGYLYIGFIWVDEEYRSRKIGTKWLQSLINKYPEQKFWLTVDDEKLISFYSKAGFQLKNSLKNGNSKEWILVYEPGKN